MGLTEKSSEFLSAVKQTREYKELKQAKSKIDGDRDLRRKFNEFTRKQMDLYKAKNKNQAESLIAEINKSYKSLSDIPEISRFLKASKLFNEMMAKVYKRINEAIESDLNLR